MFSVNTLSLFYRSSASSNGRLCFDIPIPHKTTTFLDVLEAAIRLIPTTAGVEDEDCDEVFPYVDKKEWKITEAWNGLERCVSWSERPFDLLCKWGKFGSQVRFFLKPKKQPAAPKQKKKRIKRNVSAAVLVKREWRKIELARQRLLEFDQLEEVSLSRQLHSVDKQLLSVNKDLQATVKELAEEEEVEKLRDQAHVLKKEAEAKNELNSMQRSKMTEQKDILAAKLAETRELEFQISELQAFKQQQQLKQAKSKKRNLSDLPTTGGSNLRPSNSSNDDGDGGESEAHGRASICDDGSYLVQSLEGRYHMGYHTPPLWSRTQSASVVLEGRLSPHSTVHGSLRRTPLSSKRRAELVVLNRRNSEEGLVLKLVESKRRASLESGLILRPSKPSPPPVVAMKLIYEENPSGSDQKEEIPSGSDHKEENPRKCEYDEETTSGGVQRECTDGGMHSNLKGVKPDRGVEHSRTQSDVSSSSDDVPRVHKSILKKRKSSSPIFEEVFEETGSEDARQTGSQEVRRTGRRIKFDEVAVLFSAAAEGEYQLFVDTCRRLGGMACSSFQGVTVLHYAVCSGNLDLVRYIVSRGFNVNQTDHDGWTPLHCAASSCDIEVMRYLVGSGASLFLKTSSDLTPLRVCFEEFEDSTEEDKSAASQCLDYLLFAQQELGSINNGILYALFDYDPREEDYTVDEETNLPFLRLRENERLKVVSKGGDQEREEELWWVAENRDRRKGLVPCTLLGAYPKCTTERV